MIAWNRGKTQRSQKWRPACLTRGRRPYARGRAPRSKPESIRDRGAQPVSWNRRSKQSAPVLTTGAGCHDLGAADL